MATQAWRDQNQDQMRAYRRKWYAENKDRAKQRVIDRKREMRAWLQEWKREANLACMACGEDDVACLDFHHRDPSQKEGGMYEVLKRGWGKERILQEIAKCDVLCANCHRKLHARGRG